MDAALARQSPAPSFGRLAAADGVPLAYEIHGPAHGAPLVFAHGFGQTRHAWRNTASVLGALGYRALAADGRGHGDSGWIADGEYRLQHSIDDAARLSALAGERPVWIGASMGGLLGMVAEASVPGGRFAALVLVDITPRWETRGVDRIIGFMRAHPQGFASVHEAQAAVREHLPHRADDGRDPARLHKLLVPMDNGRLRWHWDPRLLETITQETTDWSARLPQIARQLALPVLLVSGGRSDVVSRHTIEEFQQLVPHAEHHAVDDATHMVVGDANDRFTSVITAFLHRLGHAPRRATT